MREHKINMNLNILHEDNHIIVCVKPHGFPTQSSGTTSHDMVSLLTNHLYKQDSSKGKPYLAVIHRLDQPVMGILVFAKTPFAAKELNKQLQHGDFGKYYRALVSKAPALTEDTLENHLVKDGRTNTSRICSPNRADAKLARLSYQVVKKGQGYFNLGRGISQNTPSQIELEVHLDTGRHHQIRVQLAHIGCPIVGDTKYGSSDCTQKNWHTLHLCAYKLQFEHPKTKKHMLFTLPSQEHFEGF